jgi:hypothetical protein
MYRHYIPKHTEVTINFPVLLKRYILRLTGDFELNLGEL